MLCNNTYCLWNNSDSCCHESQEGYENAVPNTLDCPSSLRADFELQLHYLVSKCENLLFHRNMKELMAIKKFIDGQRK